MKRSELLLTEEEIIQITGYKRPALQAEWCIDNGIEYRLTCTGKLVIVREHFMRALGVITESSRARRNEPDYSSLK